MLAYMSPTEQQQKSAGEQWDSHKCLELCLAFAIVAELAPPLIRLKGSIETERLPAGLYVELERMLNPSFDDPGDVIPGITTTSEDYLNLLAILAADQEKAPSWEVFKFDIPSRISVMRRHGAPLPPPTSPLSIHTFRQAYIDDDLTKLDLSWLDSGMFNMAFIGNKGVADWGSDVLEAFDLCSTRMVRVDPRSLVDIHAAWEERKEECGTGMYFMYNKISRVIVGDAEVYQISGFSPTTLDWIKRCIGFREGELSHTLFTNLLRSTPFSPVYRASHYL
ncbi:hypothetical protein C8A00DRAFT_31117 [Chaetomidium leptoderma]|uniref:Uncharacterized protein n=1 Tax=Chaetomidium leptoderma TaxID=669021 RepID=A0AAN6ZZ19_9PEZI|nr:hypothetical protein C8A00DRAFT_31117 [Chaetomidium leptoderma]